jgi:hypothetical protein
MTLSRADDIRRIVFGRVVLVGDAAASARPHVGIGVAKAGGDADALADALRDHDDIDAALAHYDAVRQPNSERIALHGRKRGTHLGVDLSTAEDRADVEAVAGPPCDDGLDCSTEFPGDMIVCLRSCAPALQVTELTERGWPDLR